MQNATPKPKPIIIVQGAQWGSEAKGMVAAALAKTKRVDLAVRTGAVNAGHTVYYDHRPFKMQQLPTAWVIPTAKLILGAGTFVNPEILASEIELVTALTGTDVRERLYIDHRASLHLPEHQTRAQAMGRHYLIGATAKGCSVAITDKIIKRGKGYKLFMQWWIEEKSRELQGLQFVDTVEMLHDAYDSGQQILLEGTQGSLLDLHLGPYPYTTHKQTQAAEWVGECGLAPGMAYETVMVCRTYPIRVAGNSGPMAKETTWSNIARTINRKLMLRRQPQLVKSFALDEFERACTDLANGKWQDRLPTHADGSANWDFHKWSAETRVQYREALSELHAHALQAIGPHAMEELAHLFELTTVTKKLRRVAEWNGEDVKWSCRVNRGSYIVLTFFNYLHPETWNAPVVEWNAEYERTCYVVEVDAKIPVRYISTGPEGAHLQRVDKIRAEWRDGHQPQPETMVVRHGHRI